jgi:hypothetical protein
VRHRVGIDKKEISPVRKAGEVISRYGWSLSILPDEDTFHACSCDVAGRERRLASVIANDDLASGKILRAQASQTTLQIGWIIANGNAD